MTTDLGTDEEPSRAPIRVSAGGVVVRKIASRRGDDAVVIDLTLRSGRDDTCTVLIEDTIPDPLRDSTVEFHPRYDPTNWSRDGAAVVYEAPIGPGVVRRTVYGVVIDDPDQLDLFRTQPSIDVREAPAGGGAEQNGEESFEFGPDDDRAAAAVRNRSPSDVGRLEEDSVVDSLVAEVRDRELTGDEREALREALGLEVTAADLDALRAAVVGLEDRTDGLAAELDDLEGRVEREARWRADLRQFLVAEPD